MTRVRSTLTSLLAAFACATAFAQEPPAPASRPAAETKPDAAEALLRAVDARIYYPEREGLATLRFSYAPEGTGSLKPDFRVQVTWRKDAEPAVTFLDLEKRPLDRSVPHVVLDAEHPERPGRKLAEDFAEGARTLHRVFLGRPYSAAYASFRKRIETKIVNLREETTLVLEPTATGALRRVEMSFGADGLPWRIVQRLARPENGADAITVYPVFKTVADRLVMTGYKEDLGVRTDQVVIEHQKVGGFVLPASIERIVKGSKVGGSKTVFDDVEAGG
jgi:hypothetical protein